MGEVGAEIEKERFETGYIYYIWEVYGWEGINSHLKKKKKIDCSRTIVSQVEENLDAFQEVQTEKLSKQKKR